MHRFLQKTTNHNSNKKQFKDKACKETHTNEIIKINKVEITNLIPYYFQF